MIDFRRKKAIKDLLTRNAEKLDPWMSRGLLGSLHIPSAWVEEAKVSHLIISLVKKYANFKNFIGGTRFVYRRHIQRL
jgi:hypothetical protein